MPVSVARILFRGNVATYAYVALSGADDATLLEVSERLELLFELGIERRGRCGGHGLRLEGVQLLEEGAQPGTVLGKIALLGGISGHVVELGSAREEEEAFQLLPLSLVERSLVSEVLGERLSR